MMGFNRELINKVKLFYSEDNHQDIVEGKYSFLRYVFKNLESVEADFLEICEEEFDDLHCNIDAWFCDEENLTDNLYIAIYNENNDDETIISDKKLETEYSKITNFISKIITCTYSQFNKESKSYEIADRIYKNLKRNEIVVNIIANYIIPPDKQKADYEEIFGVRVLFRTYDLRDLKNKFSQLTRVGYKTDFKEKFQEGIDALLIASTADYDVYMCSMKGVWLAQLYKEDNIKLLEQNIRSYLKRTAKVNAGIIDTVKNTPKEFVTYNNGISAIATDIIIDNEINYKSKIVKINGIINFQIVNGGQTTATLYECYRDALDENLNQVIVPVKLTVIKNIGNLDNLIRDISLYSNTQTAIKKSDPFSNLRFYVEIKKLSQSCVSSIQDQNYMCYFERTNGEYNTENRRNGGARSFLNTNPKDKKFNKIDLANAINCWDQHPNIVCEGREKSFIYFNSNAKNMLKPPDEIFFKCAYACVILYRKLYNLAKELNLTYINIVVAYTLSLISFKCSKRIDLMEIWELKDITQKLTDVSRKLLPKVHKYIINSPVENPEPRMWARKEQCWNNIISSLNFVCDVPFINAPIEFFPSNEALTYIKNEENLFSSLLWMKLLMWDNKYKVLNKKQKTLVKYIRTLGNKDDKNTLTKKQKEDLLDIFMFAVQSGFQYNKV